MKTALIHRHALIHRLLALEQGRAHRETVAQAR